MQNIKTGDFIQGKQWCKCRLLRVDYIGKERGMGTVFMDGKESGESPFSFLFYEKNYINYGKKSKKT